MAFSDFTVLPLGVVNLFFDNKVHIGDLDASSSWSRPWFSFKVWVVASNCGKYFLANFAWHKHNWHVVIV